MCSWLIVCWDCCGRWHCAYCTAAAARYCAVVLPPKSIISCRRRSKTLRNVYPRVRALQADNVDNKKSVTKEVTLGRSEADSK